MTSDPNQPRSKGTPASAPQGVNLRGTHRIVRMESHSPFCNALASSLSVRRHTLRVSAVTLLPHRHYHQKPITNCGTLQKYHSSSHHSQLQVLDDLDKKGWHAYAPDWIGFGYSEKPQPRVGFNYTEQEFHTVRAAVARGAWSRVLHDHNAPLSQLHTPHPAAHRRLHIAGLTQVLNSHWPSDR